MRTCCSRRSRCRRGCPSRACRRRSRASSRPGRRWLRPRSRPTAHSYTPCLQASPRSRGCRSASSCRRHSRTYCRSTTWSRATRFRPVRRSSAASRIPSCLPESDVAIRFSRLDATATGPPQGLPPAHPVAKWVSNVAMQVTSKNNHKKFGNIWGCFRLKYRTGTKSKRRPKAAITTAFRFPFRRKCRLPPPDGAVRASTFHPATETIAIRMFGVR